MPLSASQTLITGVYRTGSEYLAHLLNCHPEINVSQYRINVLRFVYGRFDPIHERTNYLSALGVVQSRLKQRYGLELPKTEVLACLDREPRVDYGFFYDTLMTQMYLSDPNSKTSHWAEKNQLLWREIPIFLNMMRNGRAVMILRDPRAILLSFKHFTYAKPPAYLGAIFNALDAMKHVNIFKKQYPATFYWVRFEDMARQPEATTQKMWRFLGLTGEYNVHDQSNWKDTYGSPWFGNSAFQAHERFCEFDVEENINRWTIHLSKDEIGFTELICGDVMESFGYPLKGRPINLSTVEKLIAGDAQISSYYQQWLKTGEGIQAFPNDPLTPANWRKRGVEPVV